MTNFQKITAAVFTLLLCALLSVDGQAQNFATSSSEKDPAAAAEEASVGADGAAVTTAEIEALKQQVAAREQQLLEAQQAVEQAQQAPQDAAAPAATTFDQSAFEGASAEEILAMVQPLGPAGIADETAGTYTLGATDVIEITVMRHPEVSGEYPINKEGKIQYEFVGDISLAGLDKDEAAEVITEALSEYIVAPEVNIKIIGYNSKVVYVVGEVFRPGKIFMRGDTISVREALVQAGLPRLSGITKRSRLIKPSDSGRPEKKNLNVYALLYEGDLRENDIMEPGDLLYIPPTFLTRVMRTIAPVAAPIGQAAGAHTGIGTLGTPPSETRY